MPKRKRVKRSKRKRDPLVVANKASALFLFSYEWRRLRMVVLKERGARCECCGSTPADGVRIHVDHIKPRKLFPELALVKSNLQVLCEDCNHGKGNWDTTDWRRVPPADPAPVWRPFVRTAPAATPPSRRVRPR